MKKLFVIFAAIAMVGAFTASSMAADWGFYGSSRLTTFWGTETDYGDEDLDLDAWAQQGNSRIGANAKGDVISGRFEYGTGVNLRLLYADWGSFRLGQFYSPANIFISNQVYGGDADALNVGGLYGGRQQGVQWSTAGFKVALLNPKNPSLPVVNPDYDPNDPTSELLIPAVDVSGMLPKIELAYRFSTDAFWLQAVGGYQTYDVTDAANDDIGVDAYVYGFAGGFNLAGFSIAADIMGGQNLGAYGIWTESSTMPSLASGDIDDNTAFGGLLVVGYGINDMFGIEAGYGFLTAEVDGADSDDTSVMYLQTTINIAKGFFIIPEIGMYDYSDDTEDGKFTYFGAKTQMNF